jgi:hypothetical protein
LASSSFPHLNHELTRWKEAGSVPRLWWRDDDAVAVTPALERLQTLAKRFEVNVGLASIPRFAHAELAAFVHENASLSPLCHGLAHMNHASARLPSEFGTQRSLATLERDVSEAYTLYTERFGEHALKVFVPPFNHMTAALIPILKAKGFEGVSSRPTRAERLKVQLAKAPETLSQWVTSIFPPLKPDPDFIRADVHIHPIVWSAPIRAASVETCENALVQHLRARRLGLLPVLSPIGFVTHHLDHDEPIWCVVETLLEHLKNTGMVQFLTPSMVFEPAVR